MPRKIQNSKMHSSFLAMLMIAKLASKKNLIHSISIDSFIRFIRFNCCKGLDSFNKNDVSCEINQIRSFGSVVALKHVPSQFKGVNFFS